MYILSHFVIAAVLSGTWATLLFPESFPLHKRQSLAPGTPLYECHANCGGVIVSARSANYCSNSTFTSELSACLNCALTYDIWQYYGDDVSSAAEKCGDNATPSPSSAVSSTASATGTAATTSATGAASNTTPVSGGSTSSPVSSPTSSPVTSPGSSSAIVASSASATPSNSSATPSSTATSGTSTGATWRSSYSILFSISILLPAVLGLLM